MRAVRFHEHGGPEVLRLDEVPTPEPRAGEALVRVRAVSLNHLDIWQRRGIERVRIPLPHTSGADVAGEVAAAPEGTVAVGTRVMLQPGLSCGRCLACLEGRDNECPRYDVLGYQSDGGYAEYVRVPLANLIPIPDTIGFVEASAFPLTFLTAWHMLITRARLVAGERVLVLGAGSGVGQAAIQIARLHGAHVIATAGTDEKLAKARALGAHATINHTTSDIGRRGAPPHRRPRRRGGGRARRHRHLGPQRAGAGAGRPPGHLRRHHRLRRRYRSACPVQSAALTAGLVHGP
jgi:NADPH:quinone reductase-like Zn-dependent oxidoreductase